MVSLSFLLKIPLMPEMANYVWPISDTSLISPEYCLEYIWDKGDCWQSLIVKSLGIIMILGAFLNKAPILANVLSKQSVAGLSIASLYSEVIVYLNQVLYGLLMSLPFTSYGENGALLLQNVTLIFCCWQFSSPRTSWLECVAAILIFMVYIYVAVELVPDTSILIKSLVPINIYSKGAQIMKIIQDGHTGSMSFVPYLINVLGAIIRVGTTLGEATIDMNLLLSHASGGILNGMLLFQFYIYGQATRNYWLEQEKKKKSD